MTEVALVNGIRNIAPANGRARKLADASNVPDSVYKELCVALIDCFVLPTKMVKDMEDALTTHQKRVEAEAKVKWHEKMTEDVKQFMHKTLMIF